MSKRRAQVIVLCEDSQQAAFVRRYLKSDGLPNRKIRILPLPGGQGSAESYVRESFPIELDAYRKKRSSVAQHLIVVIDGDKHGVEKRMTDFDRACSEQGVQVRQPEDQVAIFVPTWNIESWLAYLDGHDVNESRRDYPRLERERDCKPRVKKLLRMCKSNDL